MLLFFCNFALKLGGIAARRRAPTKGGKKEKIGLRVSKKFLQHGYL